MTHPELAKYIPELENYVIQVTESGVLTLTDPNDAIDAEPKLIASFDLKNPRDFIDFLTRFVGAGLVAAGMRENIFMPMSSEIAEESHD